MNVRSALIHNALVAFVSVIALVAVTVTGCGGGDDAEGGADGVSRRSGDVQLVDACELIRTAQVDAVIGAFAGEPSSFNTGFDNNSAVKYSSCAYSGENHGILLKLSYPYGRSPATSEEWAAEVREDYAKSVEAMDDPELIARMGNPQTHALDGLGDVAAWIDTRAATQMIVLHAIHTGRQRTHIELYAPDLDVARQVTERLLPALP